MSLHVVTDQNGRSLAIGACHLPHPLAHLHAIKLARFVPVIPTTVSSVDYSGPAMSVISNVEDNDRYGCCVESEEAHFIAVVTGAGQGQLYAYSPDQVLAMYSILTNPPFNAADPSTDQGTDPVTCLNYFTQNPYADGSQNVGWAMGDATNQALVQYAVDTFGNGKLWLGLPDAVVANIPTASGFVWDVPLGAANTQNGHCVGICGFTPQGVQIMTWGLVGTITWAALSAWCVPLQGGGIAHRVSTDWIGKASSVSPTGLDLAGLKAAFAATFGTTAS